MTSPRLPVTKPTKAIVAAVGSTLTALMTALATVTLVLDDDAVDLNEVSSLATAALSLVMTIYAVWKVPNRPVETGETDTYTHRRV